MGPQELYMALHTKGWNVKQVMMNIFAEYDAKFELVVLLDKHGNFIKYL